MTVRIRHWQQLKYRDPKPILIGLRRIADTLPLQDLPYDLRSLRRRDVRHVGEGRQAALFCWGLTSLLGTRVTFAMVEASDYDMVAAYEHESAMHFVPVQLKELVPKRVNAQANLQEELDKISKYADSKDLVVAFFLNTDRRIQFSELRLPDGTVKELWFYGAANVDQSEWVLLGNFLGTNPLAHRFAYPEA